MEISLKELRKILNNEILLRRAEQIDNESAEGAKKGDKILSGQEINIFEAEIVQKIKTKEIDKNVYQSIFGFDYSERAEQKPLSLKTKASSGNIKISNQAVQINTNAKFKPDGSLLDNNVMIQGNIIFKDSEGNEHSMKLIIQPHILMNNDRETHKEALENSFIPHLQKAINGLSQDLKSDLYNEVNFIELGGQENHNGFGQFSIPIGQFQYSTNHITLNLLGNYSNGRSFKSGINSETLAHEIGHALDELHSERQSDSTLEPKFEKLKNILAKNGYNIDCYKNQNNIQGYWLKNHQELIAELTSYFSEIDKQTKNGNIIHFNKDSRFYMLNQVVNSNNPEIQAAFKEVFEEYTSIVNNSRSLSSKERRNIDKPEYAEQRIKGLNFNFQWSFYKKSNDLRENYMKLYAKDEMFFDYISDKNQPTLLLNYWKYTQGTADEDSNKIFKHLDEQKSNEWEFLKLGFEKFLAEAGLFLS